MEGGIAVLEFGNVLSLNAMHAVRMYNCPHFFLTLSTIDRVLRDNGFSVIDKRYFYFVPSFFFRGIVRRLLHASIREITLNEWLSSLPILRNFSCKVLLVAMRDRRSVLPMSKRGR